MDRPHLADGFEGERFQTIPSPFIEKMKATSISSDLYLCCIGYFPNAKYHYIHRSQGIEEHIIIYVKEGCGWVQIGEHRYSMKKDEFIIIPQQEPHSYGSDEEYPWSIYWLHFSGSKARSIAEGLNIPTRIAPAPDSRIAERIDLFEELFSLSSQHADCASLEYACLVLQHLLGTFRYVEPYRKTATRLTSRGNDAVKKVIHFMEENVENRLSVEQLTAVAHLSKAQLYRRFTEEIGQSPLDYFIRLKVNKACLLLIHSSMHIGQIAFKLGFSETQYFSRTFKKITGVTAGEFRRQYSLLPQEPDKE